MFDDLREKPHLMVWALVGGMLWAVANTLTIFAVRNVGLAIAFACGIQTAWWGSSPAVCCSKNCVAGGRGSGAEVIGGAARKR